LTLGTAAPIPVTVTTPSTNTKIDDLVSDLNAGLVAAHLNGLVVAGRVGNYLTLSTSGLGVGLLKITWSSGDPAAALGFTKNQTANDLLLAAPRYTITATNSVPPNVQINGSATFKLTLGAAAPVQVIVTTKPTDTTIDDLVREVNAGLVQAQL